LVVGERLAARRGALGWTQADLERASGVNKANISQIERGHMAPAGQVERLARALGLDLATLEVVEGGAEISDVLGELERLLVEGRWPGGVRRGVLELLRATRPSEVAIAGVVGRLFPAAEWSPGARREALELARVEWERAQDWSERLERAHAAAGGPLAASAGVAGGTDEEALFLARMKRHLRGRSRG
jgi:transcriptional regulator with XRE-family HTH domain